MVFIEVKKQRKTFVQAIIIQDMLWVIASILICIFHVFAISEIAYVIILLVALIVATFAILQYKWRNYAT
jgi:hypothetical protein